MQKISGRPSVPDLDAPGRGSCRAPPKIEVESVGRGISFLLGYARRGRIAPARAPCRLLRRWGNSRGGRPSHFLQLLGTRGTASSPSHAIIQATAAALHRVPALVVGRSPYVATPAS